MEGACLLFCLKYIFSKNYQLKKEYKQLLFIFFLGVIWDIITSLFNWNNEFYLAKKMLFAIASFFFAHYIYVLSRRVVKTTNSFIKLLAIVVLVESIIALLISIFPQLNNILKSFLVFEILENEIFEGVLKMGRFHGIGTAVFFGVLSSSALGLMSSIYCIIKSKSTTSRIFWIFAWLLIFIVSFFTARFTLFIGAVSILYCLYSFRKSRITSAISIVIIASIACFVAYSIIIRNANDELLSWAFDELTGKVDGGTSAILKDWWFNTKINFKTLIIGDARYSEADGMYYMYTDVGILRQIFYGGIIGLILNLIAHGKTLMLASRYFPKSNYSAMLFFLMLGYIAILFKGDASMISLYILLLVYNTRGIFSKKANQF